MGRQGVILLSILIAFVLIMAAAAYYSQRTPDTLGSGASSKRFMAKSGTERESAAPLAIRKSAVDEAPGTETLQTATMVEENARDDLPGPAEIEAFEEPDSPTERLIQSAQTNLDPEQGLAQVEQALAAAYTPEETARLHTALGQIQARKMPPDLDAAAAAFEAAMTAAPDIEARQRVVRDAMRAYLAQGRADLALAQLEAIRRETPPSPQQPVSIEIDLLEAQLHEESGDPALASAVYRNLLDTARKAGSQPGPKEEELLRLAAMRLARIYRAEGRDKEAEILARELQSILSTQHTGSPNTD
jgi:tetratricopeptide (TPR) repeat protein